MRAQSAESWRGPVEATAIGNILVQAMATGDVKSLAEARGVVLRSFEVQNGMSRGRWIEWEKAYRKFQGDGEEVEGKRWELRIADCGMRI